MKTTVNTYYEIEHGNGTISGSKDKFRYDTSEEALESAKEFKENPSCKNQSMTQSNIEYWKRQEFTIAMKTIITTKLHNV